MKQAILNYILRSPAERKRLHIELLPRSLLNSGQRIGREGGFSIDLFPKWHNNCIQARNFLNKNLVIPHITISALLDWFQDFKHFSLIELDMLKNISLLGFAYR